MRISGGGVKILKNRKYYPLGDIVKSVVDNFNFGDEFCIYGDLLPLKGGKTYLIDDFPGVDGNDQEIYPDSVRERGLNYLYSGQQFADVVKNLVGQIRNPGINDFELALDYYSKNDCFLDFGKK